MCSKILSTIAMLLFVLSSHAQMGTFYNPDKQLSSSLVNQVYLDHNGFLWVATRDGLNRYDGYQFRVFRRENPVDSTLKTNMVNAIMQDRQGLFYVGMYDGIQTWDGKRFNDVKTLDWRGNENFCYACCFLERANGDILAGTSGLGVVKFKNKTIAQQVGGPFAGLHTVSDLLEDRKGNLWLVSDEKGLQYYDGMHVKTYKLDARDVVASCLCEDHQGNIYVSTTNAGVFRLYGQQFVQIPSTSGLPVSSLYCNSKGEIMIGCDGKGLAVYNPETGSLVDNPYYSPEVDLSKAKVYSITEDHHGNLWLGMLQKGVFKQPVALKGFHYMGYRLGPQNQIGTASVSRVIIDSKDRIWVGTDKGGLYCFDGADRLIKHYTTEVPSVIMALTESRDGRIWIGSYREGYGFIDPATQKYHHIDFPQDSHLSVMDIDVDDKGELWLATMRWGVLHLSSDGQVIKSYVKTAEADKNRKVNCIVNDYVNQVSLSPDYKRLYAATSLGVCCLDIASDNWVSTFGTNCLDYGSTARAAEEYDGYLWEGTSEGLFRYRLKDGQKKRYMKADGLPDNGIASIVRDEQGKLWMGTSHGLCQMDPLTGKTQNYFVDDGLQANEFSDGAVWRSKSGIIVLGGTGGVTWFKPQDIVSRTWEPSVQLTAFIINGQPASSATRSGNYQVSDTAIFASNRFELSYHDNSFSLQFSTLTYENPEHISYLYSINGEPFIRMQQGNNVITFSHMPSGTYRFRVMAERNGMETAAREFTVVVHSPWYRSAWAYFFYALIVGMFLWQFVAYRRHREQARLRLQSHLHAEELGEAKIRFFMNMSHEIRTPMTLIITPLMQLLKNDNDPSRRSTYETIKRNAERILSLINQMMDLRKIDKGQMQMRMSETDLVSFIKDIHHLFGNQAKTKNITLLFEHDADTLPVWIDRQNFDKVVMNILSNAFKFTPTGGEIGIRLTHDDKQATIAVRDNGEQIPVDKLDKIFQRFYQTTSSVNDRHAGTGIGLDLTRSLVELHHGTITAHNLEQGCEFVINIPLGNAHLKPEEMILTQDEAIETVMPVDLMDEVEAEEITPVVEVSSKRPLTLVIAEDDDEIRNYLESELGKEYDVHACENGRDALGEILRTMPDLVITDVMMPEMDGNTLCSKLKSNPETNIIPVILLTAKSRDEDKLEGLETGADDYVVKPFNMDILRRKVVNLINSHRLLRLKYERNDNLEEQLDDVSLKSPDAKLLDRIMECVNKNLNNSDLNVDMIADQAGISRVHLHRKMKELTGQTPHDFIRNLRLKKAAQLLTIQGMNVTEVMYACGFSNAASFSTLFKKVYGMSPRDYMKEHEER